MVEKVTGLYEQFIKLSQSLNYDTMIAAARGDDPSRLSDTIAANLQLPVDEKQDLLETVDPLERLNRIAEILEIELEKLMSDSLYLDNQAHAVVIRMRDMDSGTKSQLRRLYNAVRRAVRAPENERQHQFVMLRARLAYTIARHSLRSLDALERLLLQVTRKNDARGYERFKDLFEAIVAYNE